MPRDTPSRPAAASEGFLARLALSRADVDRDALSRSRPLAELRSEPGARLLPMHDGRALVTPDPALILLPDAEAPTAAESVLELYLGRTITPRADLPAGTPVIAVTLDDAAAERLLTRLTESGVAAEWGDLRQLGRSLDTRDSGLFTEALALINWHAAYAFAPHSGRATTVASAGWVRIDPETGKEFFPRTDAAIIVGITDGDDRLLLGSNALWPADRYSLLAGFVEPGESLEAAVVREVFEESGIVVEDPVYLGSQPWPFPASLMLGFRARVAAGTGVETRPDGEEILDLRWFSRAEMAAAVASGELKLPGGTSIARAIIEEWFGGPLGPDQW